MPFNIPPNKEQFSWVWLKMGHWCGKMIWMDCTTLNTWAGPPVSSWLQLHGGCRPFDNKSCRKMNGVDKERYFREKEAYERITGQVFPVSKVLKRSFSTLFSSCISGHCLLQHIKCSAGCFRCHQVSLLPTICRIWENSIETWECSKVHQSWLRSAKYQEHRVGGRVLQVIKKSTAGDILGNLLSIAFLCSTHMPLIKVISLMFCSPATNVWCSIVTGCSRTGWRSRTKGGWPKYDCWMCLENQIALLTRTRQ